MNSDLGDVELYSIFYLSRIFEFVKHLLNLNVHLSCAESIKTSYEIKEKCFLTLGRKQLDFYGTFCVFGASSRSKVDSSFVAIFFDIYLDLYFCVFFTSLFLFVFYPLNQAQELYTCIKISCNENF